MKLFFETFSLSQPYISENYVGLLCVNFGSRPNIARENDCLKDDSQHIQKAAHVLLCEKSVTTYSTGCLPTKFSAQIRRGVLSRSRSDDDVTAAVVAHAHSSSTAVHMTSR